MSQAPDVVEQKCDPVARGLEGVESTLDAGEGGELPLQLESGMRDAVGVLGHDFETDCTKQIGAEGHDVPTRVSGLSVGMLGDDGRIVRRKRRNEGVFEARLVKNLVVEAGNRGLSMVHCCVTEGVVEDQGPACVAFVVLPEPHCEFVKVLQPRGLLVPQEVLFIELGEELRLSLGHLEKQVPGLDRSLVL